jgi:hypothetical protein
MTMRMMTMAMAMAKMRRMMTMMRMMTKKTTTAIRSERVVIGLREGSKPHHFRLS